MSDITILTCPDHALTKTHTKTANGWGSAAFDGGYLFNALPFACQSIDDLAGLLGEMESHPHSCIIRGRLRADTAATGIRRLLHATDDSPATFEDAPCPFVMIDIDDCPAPSRDASMASRLARAVKCLPEPFQNAAFAYQWSSSTGIKDPHLVKVHLWFWLTEPVTSEYLATRARHEKWSDRHIDCALFNAVQAHYTAAPLFIGARDPLQGQRTGIMRMPGWTDTVALHGWNPPAPKPAQTYQAPADIATRLRWDAAYKARFEKWMQGVLDKSYSEIGSATSGTRNGTIFVNSIWLGRLVAGGVLDEWQARQHLESAASVCGHSASRARSAIKNGMAKGARNPLYGPPDNLQGL